MLLRQLIIIIWKFYDRLILQIKNKLQELLQTEIKVVIDISLPSLVDHGSQEFNMEEILDRILT